MSENSDDLTLASAAGSGDRKAFECLVSRHYETMFKMAFKWCGNQADAQDITQNACIKLARSIASFRGEAAFTSWLYRLVINTAKDWKRKQPSSDNEIDIQQPIETKDFSSSDQVIFLNQVLQKVESLPDRNKEALLLVVGEGLSHSEAATIIGCKENTISWYIHEARKKLTDLLGGDDQ